MFQKAAKTCFFKHGENWLWELNKWSHPGSKWEAHWESVKWPRSCFLSSHSWIHQRENLPHTISSEPAIPVRRHSNVLSLNGKWIFLQIYCMILQYRAFKRYKSGKPRTIISQKSFCVTYISFHFTFYAQAILTTCADASGTANVISIVCVLANKFSFF